MAKKISANLMFSDTIAIIATTAMNKAMRGKKGYIGTRNGRGKSGKFFLNNSTEIIAKMYKAMAPKQAMVIISPVLPVNKAIIPINIFNSNALEGVLNFGCMRPNTSGMQPVLPNS